MTNKQLVKVLEPNSYRTIGEERSIREAYLAADHLKTACELGVKTVKLAEQNKPISDRMIPWKGDLDICIKGWCDKLEENHIISLALEANQSTLFGKQIASFYRAGWCISSCAKGDNDDVLFLTKAKYMDHC